MAKSKVEELKRQLAEAEAQEREKNELPSAKLTRMSAKPSLTSLHQKRTK